MYIKAAKIFIIFVLSCICHYANCNNSDPIKIGYSFNCFTTKNGLPKMYTEALFQDRDGFIWIGTQYGCVYFDGFTFNSIKGSENIDVSLFRQINSNCVFGFGRSKFTQIFRENDFCKTQSYPNNLSFNENNSRSLPNEFIVCDFFANTTQKIVCKINNSNIEPFFKHEDLNKIGNFNKLYFDKNSNIFYIPFEKGGISIVNMNGKRLSFINNIEVYDFILYNNSLIAFAKEGLYKIKNNEAGLIFKLEFPSGLQNIKSEIDLLNNLYFSDLKHVYKYNGSYVDKVFDNANLIYDLLIDNENNLWLATYQGVYNLYQQWFKNYTLTDERDMVRVIANGNENGMYIGTFDGKLINIKNDKSTILTYPANSGGYYFENYTSKTKNSILLPGAGDILEVFNNNNIKWLNVADAEHRFVSSSPNYKYYLSGWSDNLFLYDKNLKILKHFNSNDLKQFIYSKPFFNKKEEIYIAGNKGVTKISGNKITLLTDSNINFPCMVLNIDYADNVWFSSNQKLFKINNDKICLIETYNKSISCIAFSPEKNMIVGTLNGLYIYDSIHTTIGYYTYQNGFTLNDPVRCDVEFDAFGNCWVPCIGGIACFNVKNIIYSNLYPKLHLLSTEISQDNINWKKVDNTLTINYNYNNIKFNFIGLLFSSPENVYYQYRLIGFQNEWSKTTKERSISFNNLEPGNYEFQLKAYVLGKNIKPKIITQIIKISPAFWQMPWFIVSSIIIFLLLTTLLIYKYLLIKNNKKLKSLQRKKQMNELLIQSIRLKSIPHFNSNVLAGIEYYLMNFPKEETNYFLSFYSKFTNQTLRDVDKSHRSLNEELQYVKDYLQLEKFRFGDKIDYIIEIDENVDLQVNVPNMILHTYCENAIKHGIRNMKTAGLLTLRVKKYEKGIELSVEDNGVGREFTRNLNKTRQSYGLDILNKQIELYNEDNPVKIYQEIIDLIDKENKAKGTIFKIFIPFNFNYY